MSRTTDRVTTAEKLAAMPDDGKRYESLVQAGGVVDLDDVLPGLRLDVSELFA